MVTGRTAWVRGTRSIPVGVRRALAATSTTLFEIAFASEVAAGILHCTVQDRKSHVHAVSVEVRQHHIHFLFSFLLYLFVVGVAVVLLPLFF